MNASSPHLPSRLKGIAFVLFSVCVWSGWMVLSTQGVRGSLNAFDLTALRFGTAGLVMLPVLLKKGFRVGPWGIFSGMLLACLMGALYSPLTIYGMRFAPVSHIGLINTGMLVVTTLGGIFLLKETTTPLRLVGIVVTLAGIGFLLFAQGVNGEAFPHIHRGHLSFFIGGSMWAAYALLTKAWKLDPFHVTAAVGFYSAVLFLPVYFLFLPHGISSGNLHEAVFQAFYQGIINSVFALLCYNRAVAILGATTSSAFLPLIPVLATLIAMPMFREYPIPIEWLGIALASGGVLLSTGIVGRWLARDKRLPLDTPRDGAAAGN